LAKDLVTTQTGKDIKALMTLTTAKGTGSKAVVKGYDVGGKTGTAEKVSNRGYNKSSLLSSFVAAFPMEAPKYVAIVIIDEPKPTKQSAGYATGGWTAAPVLGRTIAEMAPVLALYPYGDHHTEEVVLQMKDYLYEEAKHASQ
jgi:cell division protein FtsI (penicillin-binding protein 3)